MITQEQINALLKAGYTEEDIYSALQEQENPLLDNYNTQNQLVSDPRMNASNSMFNSPENPNMIIWQLELDNILERMEHILRGDKIKFDNGHLIWVSPKTDEDKKRLILNDYGVSEIMRILANYLNRNTILSNYKESDINDIVYDIGCEINDLLYMKYETMGMDTFEKRKNYPMLVKDIVNTIRNAYMRALMGGERTSLREARQVMQQDNITPNGMGVNINVPTGRERGILNPLRYIKGKYV